MTKPENRVAKDWYLGNSRSAPLPDEYCAKHLITGTAYSLATNNRYAALRRFFTEFLPLTKNKATFEKKYTAWYRKRSRG
ncbi:MAG: hypothetical protein ACREA0_27220, partial [bacterium]